MQRLPAHYPSWLITLLVGAALLAAGCARFNTFYNARKAFNAAEKVREEKLRRGEDVSKPTPQQVQNYQRAVRKCQKLINEYPGHSLTDDALLLMGKAYHRMQSYRMSIAKLDLLLANFPRTPYLEEALYLQALNHMFIGDSSGADAYLERLQKEFPGSEYRSEALRISGENALGRERWREASEDFGAYLRQYGDSEEADKVRAGLGEALWHLRRYAAADSVLGAIGDDRLSLEQLFDARLLRARCLVKEGRLAAADSLLEAIAPQAEVYRKSGQLTLARAELLVARDDPAAAAALLENMPQEWRSAEVNARAGELLGHIYLDRWELEDAGKQFRNAVRGRKVLDDPVLCQRLQDDIARYLLADQRLEGAEEPKASRLKLTQANALLFSLGRPRLALDRYREVIDAAADTNSVVRALYGAALVYRERLDRPDSARIYTQRLLREYPRSPQAYLLRTGERGDLFSYLQALEDSLAAVARDSLARAARDSDVAAPPASAGTDTPPAPVPALPDSVPASAAADTVSPGRPAP